MWKLEKVMNMPHKGNTKKTANSGAGSTPNISKSLKRDFDLVSPDSPEGYIISAELRKILKESLQSITDELADVKASLNYTSEKLDEIMALKKKIKNLEGKCEVLTTSLSKSTEKNAELEEKILKLEAHSRRCNLKFIPMRGKQALSSDGQENSEHLINIPLMDGDIERAHRIGNSRNASGPVIVKLSQFKTKQRLFTQRDIFRQAGVIVAEDFPAETMRRRKVFTPVLQAAYKAPQYKAKLVVDNLLLNGKLYSANDLDKLPEDLKPSVLSTISRGNTVAFFTQHSTLSNHYKCAFQQEGLQFSSSEQFYMFKKAKYFHDEATANAILKTTNFNHAAWKLVRDNYMHTALTAKFSTSQELKDCLKATGNKRRVPVNGHCVS